MSKEQLIMLSIVLKVANMIKINSILSCLLEYLHTVLFYLYLTFLTEKDTTKFPM